MYLNLLIGLFLTNSRKRGSSLIMLADVKGPLARGVDRAWSLDDVRDQSAKLPFVQVGSGCSAAHARFGIFRVPIRKALFT